MYKWTDPKGSEPIREMVWETRQRLNNKLHLSHKATCSGMGKIAILPNTEKWTQTQPKWGNENMLQIKEHDKTPGE